MTENTLSAHAWPSTQAEPNVHMESWRFGMPSAEKIDALLPAPTADKNSLSAVAKERAAIRNATLIVCANGRILSGTAELPPGLRILTRAEFLSQCPDAAARADMPQFLGSERLAELNGIYGTDPLIILVEKEQATPLELLHLFTGDGVIAWPRTIVITKPNARVSILERHISADAGAHYCAALQHYDLAPGSSVKYALVQELNSLSKAVELSRIVAAAGAEMEHLTSHPGAAWARQETVCNLMGEGAAVELFSANMLTGHKKLDQRTYQNHAHRGANSNLTYANVLNDTADSVFGGMIMVADGAHNTAAYQSNRNLLLSPKAEANSIPGLEILADGVQCSHGTATSSISEDELFYLLSRGIPAQTAKEMIARGFLLDTLNKFTDNTIRTAVESLILN